jgi:hypothetical protein
MVVRKSNYSLLNLQNLHTLGPLCNSTRLLPEFVSDEV